ncbi:MAG: helix-turn-helix transcriptional regulator [Terriglobia bacterium]|jgi:transcriptional regulator with XRE-family HTH domain
MATKKETLGERIRRIRGDTYQADFGKQLGVSQGTVSAWERDDESRPPSADMHFRLASLSPRPEDQAFFLQKAGLSQEIIMSAAQKLFADRSVLPSEGEIFRVPIVRHTQKGNEDTGELFPVAARLAEHKASTVCLVAGEDNANSTVRSGDMFLLDTSWNDVKDLVPFFNQNVLINIDIDHPDAWDTQIIHGGHQWPAGLSFGQLLCKRVKHEFARFRATDRHYLIWHAVLGSLDDFSTEHEVGEEPMVIGDWHHASTGEAASAQEIAALEAEVIKEACSHVRLYAPVKILGIVIGWFRPPSKSGK